MYSASGSFQLVVRWKLNFAGLLPFDSPAYCAVISGNWLLLRELLVSSKVKIADRTIYGTTLLHVSSPNDPMNPLQ